jgi:hypothetical protein
MKRDRVGYDRLDGRNRDFVVCAQWIWPIWATAPKQTDIVRAAEALYVVGHIGNRDHFPFTFRPLIETPSRIAVFRMDSRCRPVFFAIAFKSMVLAITTKARSDAIDQWWLSFVIAI